MTDKAASPIPRKFKGILLGNCYGGGRVIGPWRKAAQATIRRALERSGRDNTETPTP